MTSKITYRDNYGDNLSVERTLKGDIHLSFDSKSGDSRLLVFLTHHPAYSLFERLLPREDAPVLDPESFQIPDIRGFYLSRDDQEVVRSALARMAGSSGFEEESLAAARIYWAIYDHQEGQA